MISPTELALAVRRPAGRMGMGTVIVTAPGLAVDTTTGAQVAVDPTLAIGLPVDTGSSAVGPVVSSTQAKTGMLSNLSTGQKVGIGLGALVLGGLALKSMSKPKRRRRR